MPFERSINLLSHLEAQQAGEAMFTRWQGRHEEGECIAPPFDMGDCAWADMARAAWEEVWARRRSGQ